MKKTALTFCVSILLLTACAPAWGTSSPGSPTLTKTSLPVSTATLTVTLPPGGTPSPAPPSTPIPSATPTLAPNAWMSIPAVPQGVSQQMVEVYRRGLARGRDPNRFSKYGDCQNINPYFLAMFDSGDYRLGEAYASLQPTIDHFAGSWGRDSLAVRGGFNVASVQTLYWADPVKCSANKSPMVCEIEKFNPSIVLISFEKWWEKPAADYQKRLRSLVDYVLSQDVVPILGTKADNVEGDNSINVAIAQVAYEYGIPLWNYWAAARPLGGHGLTEDGFHLTGLGTHPYFDDPMRMKMAWPWRNLTALQAIDAVYRALNEGK